nr:hypothetical protein GCM10020092_007490 [Actinoplanes digitatis]
MEAPAVPDDLTLTVTQRPAALDARRGIVRLHPEVMAALAVNPGDPLRLAGRRTTAGIAARAESTASRALLYADDLVLGNLGLRDGGQVMVTPIPVVEARRVTLAGLAEIVAVVSPEMLRLALLGKVVTAGDDVSLLPQDVLPDAGHRPLVEAARRSLANRVGYAWTSTLLTVVALEGGESALVTMDTVVGWQDGQFSSVRDQAAPVAAAGGRRPPTRTRPRPAWATCPACGRRRRSSSSCSTSASTTARCSASSAPPSRSACSSAGRPARASRRWSARSPPRWARPCGPSGGRSWPR